jgi:serine/threonine protein phosphatase PrpC
MTDRHNPPRLRAAVASHPGRVRANNEDLPLLDAERGIYGVIDGVGGQAAGEVAAAIAADVILQRLSRPLGTPAERVREAIALSNNEIFRRAQESPELRGMTCVVTLAVVSGGRVTIGHVGDSRLYKIDSAGIRKLTHDHSPVGEREDAQEITEAEAMRHPRRNEVFRDVGSSHRDKDEDDYVEVIEEALDPTSAILLCSDGLSDMVSSPAIDRIVRQHAGSPEAVVAALIAAANDEGGKDNITVVYAEGPEFTGAVKRTPTTQGRPTTPPALPHDKPRERTASSSGSVARSVVRSRATWFIAGLIAGVLGALLLVWQMPGTIALGTRTLVVGGTGAGAFARISDALLIAKPGDTVRVEPGVYPERLIVPDGVHLIARVPGSVTLSRAAATTGEWVAITTLGDLTARISGFKIESSEELPVNIGIRVLGQSRTIDLVQLAGPMRTGLELTRDGEVSLLGCRFAVAGQALAIHERAQGTVTNTVFLQVPRGAGAAVAIAPTGRATLDGNVFAGFGPEFVKGVSAQDRQQMVAANVIVSTEPARVRP